MSITRVQYRERQRLTVADLRLEQEYRLALAGRHHLTHHQWGVVRGLHVVEKPAGTFTLEPGVAIDGYGREILVPAPVELSIDDPDKCWPVLLFYCEFPEQVPADRKCQDDPAPRIGQRFTWVVSDTFAPSASKAEDIALARAAGRLTGLPPWPVLVARVGTGCGVEDSEGAPLMVDYSSTRYVRHRASVLRSPTGRTRLQLGLSSLTDVYHFLLSTKDNGEGLIRRVAVDRDGVVHVWRPLLIAGTEAVGQVPVAQNKVLRIATVMPGGIGRRIRIEGVLDASNRTLAASFFEVGDPRASQRPGLEGRGKVAVTRPLSAVLRFGADRSASFKLFAAADGKPIALLERQRRRKHAEDTPPPPAVERFSVELTPTGGKLVMKKLERPVEVAAVACGDVERSRPGAGEAGTPVVQFRPANEIKADPLAREIHAVTTSKPADPVPRTELRLAGGAEDDSDASSRFGVGGWMTPPTGSEVWVPALRMDGGRHLEILAAPGRASSLDPLLDVDGTVYLPPIGKKDPLLPDLMAMAFIAGLRQMGAAVPGITSLVVTLTKPVPPVAIVRGQDLEYSLDVTWSGAVQVKRCLEIITGTAGTGDMAFRSIRGVDLSTGTSPKTFTVTSAKFTHPASKVRIEIQLLAKRGNVTGVAVSSTVELEVKDQ